MKTKKEIQHERYLRYYAKHRERVLSDPRKNGENWRKANPDKYKESIKQSYLRNKDRYRARERKRRSNPVLRELERERARIHYHANKEHYRQKLRAKKAQIMLKYGGYCVGCGTNDLTVLTIDHVNDDGHIERQVMLKGHSTGAMYYYLLAKQPRRADLQILCANCQLRKRHYGPDIKRWPKTLEDCG